MKRIFVKVAFVAAAMFGFFLSFGNQKEQEYSDLVDPEAMSGLEEWWNRPDYDCIDVTCLGIIKNFDGTVAKFVGEGKGSVPHTWSCAGCGDFGWIVKRK